MRVLTLLVAFVAALGLPAAPAQATPTHATPSRTVPVRAAAATDVVTAQATVNVAFTLNRRKARADIQTMAGSADVIGWQEITNAHQARSIDRLRGFETWWPGGRSGSRVPMNPANSNPISYRSDVWTRVDQGARRTSRAIKNVCRDRWVSWVVLRHQRTGHLVARWNIHFVPGAWSTRVYSRQAKRQHRWLRQAAVVGEVNAALVARGIAVVGGGDINRRNHPFLGEAVVYDTLSSGRIDNLVHAGGRRIATTGTRRWIPLHSDHDGLVVPYTVGTDVAQPPVEEPEDEDPGPDGDDDWDGDGWTKNHSQHPGHG